MSTDVKIDAALVKKLRDETDAPMMECKKALVEAGGDFDRAKQLLRESGQAAAAKRAGRSTSEGHALIVVSPDATKAAGVVVECETDFVARNDDFKALAKSIADGILGEIDAKPGEARSLGEDAIVSGKPLADHARDAVARIRENIKIAQAIVAKADAGQKFAAYNHANTGKKASFVSFTGDNSDAAFQVAIQTVAYPPSYLKREDVPQDVIDQEIKTETQRAINDGKPAEVAAKIAAGRVNKEYFQAQVLLEQPLYTDQKKTVSDYVKESGISVTGFRYLAVGTVSDEE